jgi:hypothetical protein
MTSKNNLFLAKHEGKAMKKQLFKRCHSSLNILEANSNFFSDAELRYGR